MMTRAGRVVVMDFGLARQDTEGGGSVSGTPAYMAPEQAAGQTLDARADVYSAGVVLAEMVSPEGIKSFESRQSVWEGVRSEPAKLPDSPWAPVLMKAVAKDREGRYHTAHTLTRALEDVTLRVEGAEDLHPYPGLASFTEDDAEYFFGREAEVEQMWRKLEGPARLFAIMGPSGAGKSSFIAAGLVANAPSGWGIIRSTPGNAAIPSLRGALTSVLASDSGSLEHLLTDPDNPDIIVDAVASSRKGHRGERCSSSTNSRSSSPSTHQINSNASPPYSADCPWKRMSTSSFPCGMTLPRRATGTRLCDLFSRSSPCSTRRPEAISAGRWSNPPPNAVAVMNTGSKMAKTSFISDR